MANYVTDDQFVLLAVASVGMFVLSAVLSYLGCCLACRAWLGLAQWLRWEE